MNHSHENHVTRDARRRRSPSSAPDGKRRHAAARARMRRSRHPVHVRSGAGTADVLRRGAARASCALADYVAVNDYEGKLLEEKTGRKLEDIARDVEGAGGDAAAPRARSSTPAGKRHEIPCGEAGQRWSIPPAAATPIAPACSTASRTAGTGRHRQARSVMGAIKIAQRGGQNHAPARDEIEARFKRAFGYSPWKK